MMEIYDVKSVNEKINIDIIKKNSKEKLHTFFSNALIRIF